MKALTIDGIKAVAAQLFTGKNVAAAVQYPQDMNPKKGFKPTHSYCKKPILKERLFLLWLPVACYRLQGSLSTINQPNEIKTLQTCNQQAETGNQKLPFRLLQINYLGLSICL